MKASSIETVGSRWHVASPCREVAVDTMGSRWRVMPCSDGYAQNADEDDSESRRMALLLALMVVLLTPVALVLAVVAWARDAVRRWR